MKKIMISILSTFLLFGLIGGISTIVHAEDLYESEANNSYATADTITLGSTIFGVINSSDDSDYYRITPSSNGKISIKFNHTYEDSYDDWNVYIYMYDGNSYTELSCNNIDLNGNESVTLPYIGAVSNRSYYVRVSRCCSGIVGRKYSISTSFTKSAYYEKENNNTFSTATGVSLGYSYSGTINNSGDKDYYKIVAGSNGKISISFNHQYEDSYDDWNVFVYQYLDGQYIELSNYNIDLNGSEIVNLPYIGAIKNGVYYICVSRCCNNVVGKNYQIKTKFLSSDNYEKEPNNTYANATNIILNNTYGGVINSPSDQDIYKIVAPMTGSLSITFNHSYEDSYDDWDIYIYKYSSGQYTELSNTNIDLNSNKKTTLSSIGTVKNGIYFVKVKRCCTGVVGKNYSLDFNFSFTGTNSLKISSVSSTSLAVVWNKVSGVTGYKVYLYNGSKLVKSAVTKNTSYTFSSLSAGTTYKVYVKAYKTVNGKNFWSASKSLSTSTKPGTPTLTVTAGTKKATLKWNKQTGATGYVVYMATSKNGKYSKIATLKGNSAVSYTKTGLTKGKTYYFKVVAYKAVGNTTLYGSYSSVKAAKIK